MTVLHPAKFSPEVVDMLQRLIDAERRRVVGRVHGAPIRVLDPFAGVGRIHHLARPGKVVTTGLEIEREWADLHPGNIHCDMFEWVALLVHLFEQFGLPADWLFDIIATSPTYGNRFADHHDARDGSTRRSYTHDIGHKLHPNNSGQVHYGARYWTFHGAAYRLLLGAVRPGGLLLLNVSDFSKAHELVPAATMHLGLAVGAGWLPIAQRTVPTRRLRGVGVTAKQAEANDEGPPATDARAPHEVIHVLRRPEAD